MDRVFLDANVLFSAAYRDDNGLLRLWRLRGTELVTSSFAINEAARNLSIDAQHVRLKHLLAKVVIVALPSDLNLPSAVTLSEKDVPILLAAIGARATHLLTGDKQHFGALFGQTLAGVLIQPPAEYLASHCAVDETTEDKSSN